MPGVTDGGFVARRQPELLELMTQRLSSDEELEGLNFRAGPLHNFVGVISEMIAEGWEGTEGAYGAGYTSSGGVNLDRVGALTGSRRRAATRSRVTATVNLDGGVTLLAGSVAAVEGQPDSQFALAEDVTNTGGTPDDFDVLFEALSTGPIAAPATSLTVIPSPVTGWNSITNAADADLGRERAEDPEYRRARAAEIDSSGESRLGKLRAAVIQLLAEEEVTGEASVYENVTLTTDGDGRPGKSWELVLWDGVSEALDNDDVAQALYDARPPAGIQAYGAVSGDATDAVTGETFPVAFSRATQVPVYIAITAQLIGAAGDDWEEGVKAALVARGQFFAVGEDPYVFALACAAEDLGFLRVTALTIGTAPAPVATTVAIGARQIATFDTANITVTEA